MIQQNVVNMTNLVMQVHKDLVELVALVDSVADLVVLMTYLVLFLVEGHQEVALVHQLDHVKAMILNKLLQSTLWNLLMVVKNKLKSMLKKNVIAVVVVALILKKI